MEDFQTTASIKYSWSSLKAIEPRFEKTMVDVFNLDLVDLGKQCLDLNPVVLNVADDANPTFESIFRRSNYFRTLQNLYPLKIDEAIYSPRVTIFQNNNSVDCIPYELNLIAFRHPILNEEGHMCEDDILKLEKIIELIFQIAYEHQHAVLILGGWKNNPIDVAHAFKRMMNRHIGAFRAIFFAIKSDNSDLNEIDNNFEIFKLILVNQCEREHVSLV